MMNPFLIVSKKDWEFLYSQGMIDKEEYLKGLEEYEKPQDCELFGIEQYDWAK